ncbi:MAG: twin-arginine translocase subunit TatB [Hahellaceae bacterium]|nr:twin-arginine translocase subunit TatB [Hahellaceae bacterium]
MFDIGFLELVLVAVVALLVLGPERLPTAARKAGLWLGRVRRFTSQVSQEIDRQLKAEELREKLRKEGDTLGLEKIQKTVDDALGEARKFEHMVTKDVTTPEPAAAVPTPAPAEAPSAGHTSAGHTEFEPLPRTQDSTAAPHARTTSDRTPD